MVYGPVAPKGSKTVGGRTIVPRKFVGPVRPGTDVKKFRRTGRSGRSSSSSRARAAEAEKAAVAKKVAAEKAAAEAAAKKVAELKRIEEAKSFAEKIRIAKEIVMSRKSQSELQRILRFRSNLIKRGVTEDRRMSTDSKTGDKLEVSQWRGKHGNRTERIKNLTKGTTTYSTFEKLKRNGVRKTGSVSIGNVPTIGMDGGVKIVKSGDIGKLIVTFPSGKTGLIKSTGRVFVPSNVAGKNYTFQDGILVKINNVVIKQILGVKEREELTGRIIKDVADIITKKAWTFIKKVNKKFTLSGKITKVEEKKLTSELKKLETKKNLSNRDRRIKKDLVEILERGERKILKGEVDLGGRAIVAKLVSRFPSYAKLFKKGAKDFGKVGKGNIIKQINTLQDFRQGQLAQAYLKAKNAQLGDKTIGSFVTIGGRASSNVMKELNKHLRVINMKTKGITLSRYAQSYKVPSNIPKTEALIKILKTGKRFTQKQINKIPKFYDFKREGVLVTKKLSSGNVKVVAMEYNKVGNKISHISYKTGVGTDTHAVVSTFKKVRKLASVKGVRVKPTGIAVVKSKIISKKKLADDVEKTISQLKTKKVFLNGKQLNKNEINFFVDVLKSQNRLSMNKRLGNVIAKLYKKSPDYNISALTNVVRVKRTLNKIIFKSGKKKSRTLGVSKKGDFLEIGFTKKRLASDRKLRVIRAAKISPAAERKVVKLKPIDKKGIVKIDRTISIVSRGVSKSTQKLVQLEVKKGATQSQVTNVKNAVMSIQTIVRPILRSSKQTITRTKVGSINSNIKKMLPGLSKTSKTSLVALNKSLNAVQKIDKLAKTPVQKSAANTMTKKVLRGLSSLRPLTSRLLKKPPVMTTPKTIPRPRPIQRPRPTKKPKPIPFPWKTEKTKTRKLAKKVMGYSFVIKTGNKSFRMRLPPLTLKDSLDVGSKYLDNRLKRTGKVVPTGMVDVVARLSSDTVNYYKRNKNKFRTVRIKKKKAYTLVRTIIEKNKYISDTKGEKVALAKKRSIAKPKTNKRKPTKRVMAKRKLPTSNQLKNKKSSLLSKRKRMINKLK